jgi:cytochrome c oxidase subunit II
VPDAKGNRSGAGEVTAYYAAFVTLVVSIAIAALAFFVSSRRFPSNASAATAVYRARSIYFAVIVCIAVISLGFTLRITPYPSRSEDRSPDMVVKAIGETWSWSLTADPAGASAGGNLVLPVGKLIEFQVSSKDVNHNFAIYSSAGEVVAQVQAMPDYVNRLFYKFDVPGHYYILCLEYCGVAHHVMNSDFEVK